MNHDRNRAGSCFETLERRRMMSVTKIGSQVFVDSTDANQEVTVSEFISMNMSTFGQRMLKVVEKSFGTFQITTTRTFLRNDISKLRVNTLGGSDVITLNTSVPSDVFGGAGLDIISGSSSNDNIFGDMGIFKDTNGQELPPALRGFQGADVIVGNNGNDRIDGNGNNDLLSGGRGNDTITGGAGFDTMYGDEDNDILLARDGVGNELVDGGPGLDSAQIDFANTTAGPIVDDARNFESLST